MYMYIYMTTFMLIYVSTIYSIYIISYMRIVFSF